MGQWTTEGLQWALEVLFSEEQSVPANFYVGLASDVSVTKDMALLDLTEVSGTGYGRQALASDNVDFTSALDGVDNRKQTSKIMTFTAGGTWTTARVWFLATTVNNAGKLLCWDSVGDAFTLGNGENHTQSIVVKGSG